MALTHSGTAIADMGCCGGDQWEKRRVTGASCANAMLKVSDRANAVGMAKCASRTSREFCIEVLPLSWRRCRLVERPSAGQRSRNCRYRLHVDDLAQRVERAPNLEHFPVRMLRAELRCLRIIRE